MKGVDNITRLEREPLGSGGLKSDVYGGGAQKPPQIGFRLLAYGLGKHLRQWGMAGSTLSCLSQAEGLISTWRCPMLEAVPGKTGRTEF